MGSMRHDVYIDSDAMLAGEVGSELDEASIRDNLTSLLFQTDSTRHDVYLNFDAVLASEVGSELDESSLCHEVDESSLSHRLNAS